MGAHSGLNPVYMKAASRLGELLRQSGVGLVYGGGNCGLMGAVADGVLGLGPQDGSMHNSAVAGPEQNGSAPTSGYVVGVFPKDDLVPAERRHDGVNELIFTRSMHERKQIMFDKADALVALPGGLGTLDELVEVLDWKKLGHHKKPVLLLNVDGFFNGLQIQLQRQIADGFSSPQDLKLFEIVETPEELLQKMLLHWERCTPQSSL